MQLLNVWIHFGQTRTEIRLTFSVMAGPREALYPHRSASWQTCPEPGLHCVQQKRCEYTFKTLLPPPWSLKCVYPYFKCVCNCISDASTNSIQRIFNKIYVYVYVTIKYAVFNTQKYIFIHMQVNLNLQYIWVTLCQGDFIKALKWMWDDGIIDKSNSFTGKRACQIHFPAMKTNLIKQRKRGYL